MQPNTPTKPVMDVAAPKGPVSAPSAQPAPAAPAAPSGEMPVRPAPLSSQPAQQPAPQEAPSPSSNRAAAPQKSGSAALHAHRTPVGLITVTIFVMLVLSALAVTVYVTSKTA